MEVKQLFLWKNDLECIIFIKGYYPLQMDKNLKCKEPHYKPHKSSTLCVVCVCVCVCVLSCVQLFATPCIRLLCPWSFPGKNTEVGCHFFIPGDIPDPRLKPASPALTGRFFYHWATWEVQVSNICVSKTTHCIQNLTKAQGLGERLDWGWSNTQNLYCWCTKK